MSDKRARWDPRFQRDGLDLGFSAMRIRVSVRPFLYRRRRSYTALWLLSLGILYRLCRSIIEGDAEIGGEQSF